MHVYVYRAEKQWRTDVALSGTDGLTRTRIWRILRKGQSDTIKYVVAYS